MPDLAPGYPPNILDEGREGVLGKPLNRVDGPLKVSGRAPYAYEYAGQGNVAYGFIVGAAIPKGRIVSLDTTEAERVPGVLLVMTYRNAPKQAPHVPANELPEGSDSFASAKPFLNSDAVRYQGEPVAFVVAETFETARDAAARVKVSYAPGGQAAVDAEAERARAYRPERMNADVATDTSKGDFEAAFAAAPVKVDVIYSTPFQHANAIEPHASMAVWEGDALTLYNAAQLPVSARGTLAATLQVPEEKVRIICKFVGGGFGSKLRTETDGYLAAMAARQLGRPVKTVLTRPQVFVNACHRTQSVQRVRLGAGRDGRLTAIGHDVLVTTSTFDEYAEQVAESTRSLYAAPNRVTSHRVARLDLPTPGDMRAPGEAIGMLAMEAAMDELADGLDMDPVELRVLNEPPVNPETGKPFSSRKLVDCYREGARRFGWEHRPRRPGTLRDGRWLVGYGMSASIRTNYLFPAEAKVKLAADGKVTVQTAMTDIGTGTYTILAQIAAESLGVPTSAVTVEIGDTNLPPSPGSGGSFGASSSGSAVYYACTALCDRMAAVAGVNQLSMVDGKVTVAGAELALRDFMAKYAPEGLEADGAITPGKEYDDYSQAAYGAFFAEVGVDVDSGETRVRRMLGVFTAGRILNAKTARSQALGGMIWGIGSALMEEGLADPNLGFIVNNDLAGYHVVAHADTPDIEAIFLSELDNKANPLKSKGVGEVGICGAGASICNAIYNACGVRVRSYPITLDKLILDPAFPGQAF